MKCPMCGLKFKKPVEIYRKYYESFKGKEVKVAFKESRCPYCGYVISTEKLDYNEVSLGILERHAKILKKIRDIEKKINRLFEELISGSGWEI